MLPTRAVSKLLPLYMTHVAYTPQAWAALTKKPENREEATRALAGAS